jgi:hypothetical protein
MAQELAIADWLEELAVYATARRIQDAATSCHLSQAIGHWYLVGLALNSPVDSSQILRGGRTKETHDLIDEDPRGRGHYAPLRCLHQA